MIRLEVEEAAVYRVPISHNATREILDAIGFEEHGGLMSNYQERYVDIIKLKEILNDGNDYSKRVENGNEAVQALRDLTEVIKDGTICFWEY